MKIAMTGGRGKLGTYLQKQLGVIDLGCDVLQRFSIQQSISEHKPDVVLHLAGKTDVDFCEDVRNQEPVIQTNVRGTSNVLTVCERYDVPVVYLSSDHVFGGKRWFGKYSEKDKPNPINYYGLTKISAEGLCNLYDNARIVRTSYLFDKSRLDKPFDYHGYPTFQKRSFIHIEHFVYTLTSYLRHLSKMPKLLHIAGSESVSWHTFMTEIAVRQGYDSRSVTKRNYELEGFAPRPKNVGLNVNLSAELGLPQWSYLDGIKIL